MMVPAALLRYVSHPEVVIDPDVAVPEWRLSERGRARAEAFARHTPLASVRRVVSSPETKAIETADVLATRLGLTVELRRATAEIDRSATGYVPTHRHDELAYRLFAAPAVAGRSIGQPGA